MPDLQRYPYKLYQIKYELELSFCFWKLLILKSGFSEKWLARFLLISKTGEIIRIEH